MLLRKRLKVFYFIIILNLTNVSFVFADYQCELYSQNELSKIVLRDLNNENFTCKNLNEIQLTFDDGPSPLFTENILRELKLRELKAIFFISTTNLDFQLTENAYDNSNLVRHAFNEGHLIASHGHNHNAYDLRIDANGNLLDRGYSDFEQQEEIRKSYSLLDEVLPNGEFIFQQPLLFRFPYGRGAKPSTHEMKTLVSQYDIPNGTFPEQLRKYWQLSKPLKSIYKFGFMHLGWNQDSGDSTSTYSMSNPSLVNQVNFIKTNIKNFCSSNQTKVVLFHDTKSITHQTIGSMIDVAKCLNLSFIRPSELFFKKELFESGVLLGDQNAVRNNVSFVRVEKKEKFYEVPITYSKNQLPSYDNGPKLPVKKCSSSYTKKTYGQCEGIDSICFNGNWYSKNDPIIKNGCQDLHS